MTETTSPAEASAEPTFAPKTKVRREIHALALIESIKRDVWNRYKSASDELKPIVTARFRAFCDELDKHGDIAF